MPTRISAGVGDHLLFIYMIPIDCKITNFFLYLFVSFLKDYHNYFLARAPTVQLTGNIAGTRTTRHASTRETCKGTGSPQGIANKTKPLKSWIIANLPARLLLRILAQSWYSPYIKFTSQNSDMQLQHICTLYTERDCYEHLFGGPVTCSWCLWRSKYKQHCWVKYDSTGGVRHLTKCLTCSYCAHGLSRENSLNNTNISNNNNIIIIVFSVWIFSTLFR